jgi:hypothetical protein
MARMEGYKLVRPIIRAKNDHQINMNGSFDLKDAIREEAHFNDHSWVVAYSSRVGQPLAEHCVNALREGGVMYGVALDTPYPLILGGGNWAESIDRCAKYYDDSKQERPKIIVFLLGTGEDALYNQAKAYCTRALRLKSQFVRVSTLQQKGASAAGKVALQMAAKAGSKLWIVPKSHKYWEGKRVALASISYSKGQKNNFTIALVGTTENDQGSVYSYSMTGLPMKDQIPTQIYRNFFDQWLRNYLKREKSLPDSLIIYREGLSDVQIKKTIIEELESLYHTINILRGDSQ